MFSCIPIRKDRSKRGGFFVNLLHLRYFAELAQTQHYTRAAEKLCITQPSLSHAIAQLEAELGVPLFEKEGRGVVLTPYGKQFLSCAQQTLSTLDGGVEELRRVGRGEGLIRLGLLRTLSVEFVPYMDLLLRLDVQILQIARPSWEREFYLIHDSRAYQSPAARSFRKFVLDDACL